MSFSLIYLLRRAGFRIYKFFYDWYAGGFFIASHIVMNVFGGLESFFALRITMKNLFVPLFGDSGLVGRVLGFLLRSLRILIAAVVYALVFMLGVSGYFVWAFIPFLCFYIPYR